MSWAKQVLSVLRCVRSRSSPSITWNEQDEKFVAFPHLSLRDQQYLVGDQLRCESCNVQYWLSPPDPSTNHKFVRKARHNGTATWFFESNSLTEWKRRGSLLWIHGKRMLFKPPTIALHWCPVDLDSWSGGREEHTSVCNVAIALFEVIDCAQ